MPPVARGTRCRQRRCRPSIPLAQIGIMRTAAPAQSPTMRAQAPTPSPRTSVTAQPPPNLARPCLGVSASPSFQTRLRLSIVLPPPPRPPPSRARTTLPRPTVVSVWSCVYYFVTLRATHLLVVVALAAQPHPDALRHVTHTGRPQSLVELCVHAHVLGEHGLGGELLHLADSARGTLLEGLPVEELVQVDGVLPSHLRMGAEERCASGGRASECVGGGWVGGGLCVGVL